jgi:hypothetical protein
VKSVIDYLNCRREKSETSTGQKDTPTRYKGRMPAQLQAGILIAAGAAVNPES